MNAEIMELSIDFSSVAKGDRTKLWCGKMGTKGSKWRRERLHIRGK